MNTVKPDLQQMRRLLHGHQWSDLTEWCHAIRALADLNDAQIDLIAAPDRDVAAAPGAAMEKAL